MSANTDKDGESCPLRFDINGMHCAACSSRIERVVGQMPGVEKVTVNLATAKAQVWAKPGDADLVRREVMDRVAKLGFSAVPATDADASAQFAAARAKALEDRRQRLGRLWPMIGFSVPLLLISMGHMLGLSLPSWLEPHASPRAFMLVQLLLTLPVVWLGRHFYIEGTSALLHQSPEHGQSGGRGHGRGLSLQPGQHGSGLFGA